MYGCVIAKTGAPRRKPTVCRPSIPELGSVFPHFSRPRSSVGESVAAKVEQMSVTGLPRSEIGERRDETKKGGCILLLSHDELWRRAASLAQVRSEIPEMSR